VRCYKCGEMGHRSYDHNPDGTISLRRVNTVNKKSAEKVAAVGVVLQCQAISVMSLCYK